jgi:hypothetical protein
MRVVFAAITIVIAVACGSSGPLTPTSPTVDTTTPTTGVTVTGGICGHRVDASLVEFGQNVVLDDTGAEQAPQGRPIQDGWTLVRVAATVTDQNKREYARIASYMMPIRDALKCDLAITSLAVWQQRTAILRINGIKTTQDLSGSTACGWRIANRPHDPGRHHVL